MSTVARIGRARVRACVRGNVQGVGFRPFVYRLAIELGLDGYVLNDSEGVVVEVEAETEAVERSSARSRRAFDANRGPVWPMASGSGWASRP